MKVRNSCIWTNGIHGEVLENGRWIKFRVNENSVRSDVELSDDTKDRLKTHFIEFWKNQEDDV